MASQALLNSPLVKRALAFSGIDANHPLFEAPPPARPPIHRNALYIEPTAQPLARSDEEKLIASHLAVAQRPKAGKGRWRHYRTMTSTSHRVFRFLVYCTRKHGKCFPSIDTIARKAKCTRMTVFRSLRELEREGWITRQPRRQKLRKNGQISERQATNSYTVHDPKSALGPVVKS